MSTQSREDVHEGMDPKLTMEALLGEMRRMTTSFNDVRERLERVENANQAPQPRVYNDARRERVHRRDVEEEFDPFVGNVFCKPQSFLIVLMCNYIRVMKLSLFNSQG